MSTEIVSNYYEPEMEKFLALAEEIHKPYIVRFRDKDGRFRYAMHAVCDTEFISGAYLYDLDEANDLVERIKRQQIRTLNDKAKHDSVEVIMLLA